MQIFPCPFCGPRDDREFYFAAEAGKARPNTTNEISSADWARYLYRQRNAKGRVREIWMHMTCQELFVIERDSLSMEVLGSQSLRGDRE